VIGRESSTLSRTSSADHTSASRARSPRAGRRPSNRSAVRRPSPRARSRRGRGHAEAARAGS
jgi:hypothetical protein